MLSPLFNGDKLPIVPKVTLLGNGEFNHLNIILTLPFTCGPKLPLNKRGPNMWNFKHFKWEVE